MKDCPSGLICALFVSNLEFAKRVKCSSSLIIIIENRLLLETGPLKTENRVSKCKKKKTDFSKLGHAKFTWGKASMREKQDRVEGTRFFFKLENKFLLFPWEGEFCMFKYTCIPLLDTCFGDCYYCLLIISPNSVTER